jgi:hypothetical protein
MKTYHVHFSNDQQLASRDIEAETPTQALAIARQLAESDPHMVLDQCFKACDYPINEIEVCDADEQNSLAVWYDDDLRLRSAATDLLQALEQAVKALNTAPRFSVPALDMDSYEVAAICDRAIAEAKGGAR